MMFLTGALRRGRAGAFGGAERIEQQVGNRSPSRSSSPIRTSGRAGARRRGVLRRIDGVAQVRSVPDAEVAALLEPWLGEHAADAELPVPAMIDVDLAADARGRLPALQAAVRGWRPARSVGRGGVADALSNLLGSLQWLAVGLVALMIGATGATVVLAARASLNTHNQTIEILHLMGATDHQIARMFQRRIAMDVLFGGLLGLAIALVVLVLIGGRVSAIGSELLGAATLPEGGWMMLVVLPVAGAALALLVARVTILRALGRLL
jgi:cell division transport system permease protein